MIFCYFYMVMILDKDPKHDVNNLGFLLMMTSDTRRLPLKREEINDLFQRLN